MAGSHRLPPEGAGQQVAGQLGPRLPDPLLLGRGDQARQPPGLSFCIRDQRHCLSSPQPTGRNVDVQGHHPTSHTRGLGPRANSQVCSCRAGARGPGSQPLPWHGSPQTRPQRWPPPWRGARSQASTDREAAEAQLSRVLAGATAGRKAPSVGGAIARAPCRVSLAPGLVATCPVLVPRPEA